MAKKELNKVIAEIVKIVIIKLWVKENSLQP